MTKRTWTDEMLREAVPRASSYDNLCEVLGLDISERARVQKRVRTLRLDTKHFTPKLTRRRKRRWTDEQLRCAAAASSSLAGVIFKLGLVPAGGNYDQVGRAIRELEIDTSHFHGMGWRRGISTVNNTMMPLEQVLVEDRWTQSHALKKRLIDAGLKAERCELCGWCAVAPDGRVPVELDHWNGDKNDNRIENLRILCPNCHSLQPTHRGLNQRRRRSA